MPSTVAANRSYFTLLYTVGTAFLLPQPYLQFQMLIVAMVHSRLDYGNAVLAGLPAYLLRRLQSVLNASARLIYRLGFRDHITDALISLHWLRVRERIEFKLTTLTYKLLHNQAPSYLGPLVRVVDVPGRRPLRSVNTHCLMVPHVRLSSVGNRAFPVAALIIIIIVVVVIVL